MNEDCILQPRALGIEIAAISACDLRVGALSYLNTKPLIFGLQALAPSLRITMAPPAELARRLRAGELDVAIVPVLEYLTRRDYDLITESAICGDGRIRSVLLFSRVPVEAIRSICLDPESMTSNALMRVLCRRRLGIQPAWRMRPPEADPASILENSLCDAVLVIGNRALALSGRFPYERDLGQEWWHLTHLPFVFAVWAVRPGAATGDLPLVLRQSLELGMTHLDLIAANTAEALGLDRDLCTQYLRCMIRYNLTDRALEGMARFYQYCTEMGLAAPVPLGAAPARPSSI